MIIVTVDLTLRNKRKGNYFHSLLLVQNNVGVSAQSAHLLEYVGIKSKPSLRNMLVYMLPLEGAKPETEWNLVDGERRVSAEKEALTSRSWQDELGYNLPVCSLISAQARTKTQ